MSATARLTLVCLTLALVLFPLTFGKPGFPLRQFADEPANLLAALSLAHDRDLACDPADLQRLFTEFPFGTDRLRLTGPEAGARFVVPIAYPLLLAPIAAMFGSNGMIATNLLLLMAMVVLASIRLRRFNDDARAILFAAGFILLSPLIAYAFRLEGVVLAATLVVVALVLGLPQSPRPAAPDPASDTDQPDVTTSGRSRWIGSAVALAIAASLEPLAALVAIAIAVRVHRERRFSGLAAWLTVFALATATLGFASYQLTGLGAPTLRADSTAYAVASPIMPLPAATATVRPAVGAPLPRIARDLVYVFIGRHLGLLPQLPFALLALAFYRRRSSAGSRRERQLLLTAMAVAIIALVALRPTDWDGGPEAISNPHLLVLYPALLFVVGSIGSPALLIGGFAVAGLTLGPLIFTVLGAPVGNAHPRAYTRGLPYRPLPVERTLLERLPGLIEVAVPGGARLLVRSDHIDTDGAHPDELWLLGAADVDLWLLGDPPLADLQLLVRNIVPANHATLTLDGRREELTFAGADALTPRRIQLRPRQAADRFGLASPVRHLRVHADHGSWPRWEELGSSRFYLGLAITVLGDSVDLNRDVYAVSWGRVEGPAVLGLGARATVEVELTNRSTETWSTTGATRVKLSYHWLAEDGSTAVREGTRSELPGPVAPGASTSMAVTIDAPIVPGDYTLVLDPIRENLAWFSDRGVQPYSLAVAVGR